MSQTPEPFGPPSHAGKARHEKLTRLAAEDPEEAWREVHEIVARTDEDGLFWVADILEDLALHHPEAFVERIETELANSRRLRQAFLRFVPGLRKGHEELEDRLLTVREGIEREFGVADEPS
jgi:hypothetical protein